MKDSAGLVSPNGGANRQSSKNSMSPLGSAASSHPEWSPYPAQSKAPAYTLISPAPLIYRLRAGKPLLQRSPLWSCQNLALSSSSFFSGGGPSPLLLTLFCALMLYIHKRCPAAHTEVRGAFKRENAPSLLRPVQVLSLWRAGHLLDAGEQKGPTEWVD